MTTSPTLFDKIGGEAKVASLVDAFYERVLGDPELAPFFAETSMEKQRRMQLEFFAAALDGPMEYSGVSLAHAHHGRGIKQPHFALFVQHLLETLQSQDIDDADCDEIIGRIATYANDITGEIGEAG